MDVDIGQTLEWLLEVMKNQTNSFRPVVMKAWSDGFSAVDWDTLMDNGSLLGQMVTKLKASAINDAQATFQNLQGKVADWTSEMDLELSWSNRTPYVAIMVIAVILWLASLGEKPAGELKKRHVKDCCLSIFDLAKTSFIKENALEVMKLVEALHFDVNYHVPSSGMTLFLSSCIGGSARLVHYLLQRGAQIRSRNVDGDTCLHLAVYATSGIRHPFKRLVGLLLKNGANVNAQNLTGDTPLHTAAMKGDADMIRLLLNYGADPSISTPDGILPVHIATNGGYMAAAELLFMKLEGDNGNWEGERATPPRVTAGLLSPEKAHLVNSSLPRRKEEHLI